MRRIVLLIVLGLLLLSCTVDESNESGPLFSLNVVDSAGNPVSGLTVSLNNAFSNGQVGGRADTIIPFCLPADCYAKLEIFDLHNNLVRNLCDGNFEAFKCYNVYWDGLNNDSAPANTGGSNIFECKMTTTDTQTGELLNDESKFMCMQFPVERDLSIIGNTDLEGSFCLENKLVFPHLYNLGEQPIYDEDACYRDTFTLSDSINIKLTNPETEEYMVFTVLMGSSSYNHYSLVWKNPQTAGLETDIPDIPIQPVIIDRDGDDNEIPFEFGLYQNYPNPFN